jgi:proliferating cell nuclear antigen
MKITISNVDKFSKFSNIFNNMKNLTNTIVVNLSKNGLYTQGLDSANVCLFECKIEKNWFDNYECGDDDNYDLGINTLMLNKILSIYEYGQTFELVINKDDENDNNIDEIQINYLNTKINNKSFNKSFTLSLTYLDHNLLNLPNDECDVELLVDSNIFCELINQLQLFDDNVEFIFNEDNIKLIANGDNGSMETTINFDDVNEYSITEDTELIQQFSLKYIKLMCNFNKIDSEMKLLFLEDKPMILKYNLDDNSYLKLFLAPKF